MKARVPLTVDQQIRAEVARGRGRDGLVAHAPMDVQIRSWAGALGRTAYVVPPEHRAGTLQAARRPLPPRRDIIIDMPRRRT